MKESHLTILEFTFWKQLFVLFEMRGSSFLYLWWFLNNEDVLNTTLKWNGRIVAHQAATCTFSTSKFLLLLAQGFWTFCKFHIFPMKTTHMSIYLRLFPHLPGMHCKKVRTYWYTPIERNCRNIAILPIKFQYTKSVHLISTHLCMIIIGISHCWYFSHKKYRHGQLFMAVWSATSNGKYRCEPIEIHHVVDLFEKLAICTFWDNCLKDGHFSPWRSHIWPF